jgi:Fe-S oxidoreductase
VGEATIIEIDDASREKFLEATKGSMNPCFQCGTCTVTCPWSLVGDFNVRKFVRHAQLGLKDALSDDVWLCTTCSHCFTKCPKGVKLVDVARGLRSLVVEEGHIPETLRDVLTGIYRYGNPFNKSRKERFEWAKELDLKVVSKDKAEVLLHTCCSSCFDPRNTKTARLLTEIFEKAGVDFGTLGREENCCGDPAFNLGEFGLFEFIAESNAELFNKYGVQKIVTTSPHSFNMFKNEYERFKEGLEVQHYTQYLFDFIKEGRLKLENNVDAKVTYHDPCYLGRHNNVYDEPRGVLKAIPGIELVEMERIRENSLCCGGGGGRIFMETPVKERFSNLRVEEAVKTGVEYLVAACPYCVQMFEDSVKVVEADIKVIDIAELVRMAL